MSEQGRTEIRGTWDKTHKTTPNLAASSLVNKDQCKLTFNRFKRGCRPYKCRPVCVLCHFVLLQTPLSVRWDKSLIFDVCLWCYRAGHGIETPSSVRFTQRHEMAPPLFHFLLIRPRCLQFLGQLFFSEYKDCQDGLSLSLAQRGSTSLTYYSSALPHRELWPDMRTKE